MDYSALREFEVNKLFRMVRKLEATGLYLRAGSQPEVKLRGVNRMIDMRPLSQDDLERLLRPLLYPEQAERLDRGEDVAFTYACDEGTAFRVVVSRAGGQLSLAAHWLRLP
jgi:Tfp pilus assembly pilus retraction ATPase PilT